MKLTILKVYHLFAILLLALLVACSGGKAKQEQPSTESSEPLMVFSAASLTDVLAEIVDSFEVTYNVTVQTNMASSGTLARQIEQGGTPDVYISASKKWANYVDSLGYILEGNKAEIAKNELVLIAPIDSKLKVGTIDKSLNFIDLLGNSRLSMGDPSHVPAGKYAKQALSYYGWFSELTDKMLPAKDVRSALMVVEMDESPLGIVYRTDAIKSEKVKVLQAFPAETHKPIVYVAGVCSEKTLSKTFFAFLNSEVTLPIWEKYGFKK